jgi:CheY-like chemotaxis protein
MELPAEPIVIDADFTRLAQVFMNLLNNAAKYSERGGRIQVGVTRTDGEVVVTVRDTGIGIAHEQLPRIFDVFSQVDRSIERSRGGLGIGLSLVRRLVALHGGSIEAYSDGPGSGSTFVVTLPHRPSPAVIESPPVRAEQAPAPALRILVVDDNRDGADTMAMLLDGMGFVTRTAYDGEEALAAVAPFRPHVILLDIGLPRVNGYDVCRQVRRMPGGGAILMIAQTGWGQAEDRKRTHEAGFDHHLVKPMDPAVLIALLKALPVQ